MRPKIISSASFSRTICWSLATEGRHSESRGSREPKYSMKNLSEKPRSKISAADLSGYCVSHCFKTTTLIGDGGTKIRYARGDYCPCCSRSCGESMTHMVGPAVGRAHPLFFPRVSLLCCNVPFRVNATPGQLRTP